MNAVNRRRAIKFLESQIEDDAPYTALDCFRVNVEMKGKDIQDFLARTEPRHLVDAAFTWRDATIGDVDYWKKISLDWVKHLESKGRATWRERILSIFY